MLDARYTLKASKDAKLEAVSIYGDDQVVKKFSDLLQVRVLRAQGLVVDSPTRILNWVVSAYIHL